MARTIVARENGDLYGDECMRSVKEGGVHSRLVVVAVVVVVGRGWQGACSIVLEQVHG